MKPTNDLSVLMPKSASGNIERKVSMNENVTAPVKKGDLLGTVTVSMGDESLGEIPIVADESVGRLTFGVTFRWILKGLFRL